MIPSIVSPSALPLAASVRTTAIATASALLALVPATVAG